MQKNRKVMTADMHGHYGSLEFIINKIDRPDKPHVKMVDLFVKWFANEYAGKPYLALFRLKIDPRRALEEGKTDVIAWTDHNEVGPALRYVEENPDLAHRILVGEEVTAIVKDRGFGVHVNVYDLDKEKHKEIQRQKGDLYGRLLPCLKGMGKVHALMHPMFVPHIRKGQKVTLKDMGKLRDSFAIVEKLNGLNSGEENRKAQLFFRDKIGIAGSDSHCGSVGRSYTKTRMPVADIREFLKAVKDGEVTFHGSNLTFDEARKEIRTKPKTQSGEVYFWVQDFSELYESGELSMKGWRDPKRQRAFEKYNQRVEILDGRPVIVTPYRGTPAGEFGHAVAKVITAVADRFFAKKLLKYRKKRMRACVEGF